MSGIQEIISKINHLGIEMQLCEDDLKLRAQPGILTKELLSEIRAYKSDIKEYLTIKAGLLLDDRKFIIEQKQMEYYEVTYLQKLAYYTYIIKGEFIFNLNFMMDFLCLDFKILEKVMNEIIRRHESLRSVYRMINGEIKQKIFSIEEFKFEIDYINLIEVEDNPVTLDSMHNSFLAKSFNYEDGPLFDLKVFEFSGNNFVLLFVIPHANADSTSLQILESEIKTLYDYFEKNEDSPLVPSIWQSRHFAQWNNLLLRSEIGESCKSFYHNRIQASLTKERINQSVVKINQKTYIEELTEDINRFAPDKNKDQFRDAFGILGKLTPGKGRKYVFYIDADLLLNIRTLATEIGSSTGITLIASFSVFMFLAFGKKCQRIDVPITLRVHEEFENVVGWLAGGFILDYEVNDRKTIKEFILDIMSVIDETSNYRYYSLERLLLDFDMTLNSFISAHMNLVDMSYKDGIKNYDTFHLEREIGVSFDLTFYICEYTNGIECNIFYNKEVYSPAIIEDKFGKYISLLKFMIGHTDHLLYDIPLLVPN